MSTAGTPSFSVKIRKTMLERFLLLGVDRRLMVILLAVLLLLAYVTRNWWLLLTAMPAHLALWMVIRRDPNQVDLYLKYRGQGDFYEPRQLLNQRNNARPNGFGRRTLC